MTINRVLASEGQSIHNAQMKRKRKCMISGCNNTSIRSHVLQKNGVISLISENQHIYTFSIKNFNSIKSPLDLPVEFRKIGINQGLTYPLFCNNHDTELFAPIETGAYDPYEYKMQLLFAYRSCCMELSKKEIQIDIQGGILNSPVFRQHANESKIDHITTLISGYILGQKDLEYFKNEFENDLKTRDSEKFTFITVEVDKLDVCTSAIFSPVNYSMIDAQQLEALDNIFISVIPKSDKTIIICGYHKDHYSKWMNDYVESWKNLDKKSLEKRISNLLIKRCETWGMSPSLYNSINEDKREKILHEFMNDVNNLDEKMETKINIFEN